MAKRIWTEEQKARQAEVMRKNWQANRAVMLAGTQKGGGNSAGGLSERLKAQWAAQRAMDALAAAEKP